MVAEMILGHILAMENEMKISVENLLTHESSEHEVSRVPCVGEILSTDDYSFEVKVVIHMLDSTNGIAAIVRVK